MSSLTYFQLHLSLSKKKVRPNKIKREFGKTGFSWMKKDLRHLKSHITFTSAHRNVSPILSLEISKMVSILGNLTLRGMFPTQGSSQKEVRRSDPSLWVIKFNNQSEGSSSFDPKKGHTFPPGGSSLKTKIHTPWKKKQLKNHMWQPEYWAKAHRYPR